MRQIGFFGLALLFFLMLPGCDMQPEKPSRPTSEPSFDGLGVVFKPISGAARGPSHLVYVPVYSRLFRSEFHSMELGTSLSIRNIDPDQSITVHDIDYFDTAGELLEQYLQTSHELDPMATVTLSLPQIDVRGGAGANFLVRWSGADDINEPIIETLMTGVSGTQGFSFIRSGQKIVE